MKISIERGALLRTLGHVQSVVERRNTIPILANVLLDATADSLTITSTDLDIQATETLATKVEQPGKTTISAHTFYEIVRKLPDGSTVDINLDGQHLTIKAGRSRFNLPVLPAEDFPLIVAGQLPTTFEMSAEQLGNMFSSARYAISTEETRYYLNGIYFHVLDGSLLAVATDGHRLARIHAEQPSGVEIEGIIIPRKAIGEVLKVIDEVEGNVFIEISASKIRFTLGNTIITSKLIDGTFPDYRRIIPTQNDKIVRISAHALAQGIDRVSTIASERTRAVKVTLKTNKLLLTVTSPEFGVATEEVEAEYSGEELDIGFNARYFLDVLNQHGKNAEIKIAFDNPNAPVLITANDGGDDIAILMPMRC